MEADRPRVLFVARTRIRLPLDRALAERYDALSARLDWFQFGTSLGGSDDDDRFRLVRPFPVSSLEGLAFHLLLPFRVVRLLRELRPAAVVVQGAHETAAVLLARRIARVRTAIVLDVHGDWRTATRLYGSSRRGLVTPVADLVAGWAVRHSDAIRTVSGYTTRLVREVGREPTAVFPAYMDLVPFTSTPPTPLPDRPVVLFVGVLERYKGLDVLAEAWPRVAARVPGARLEIVGRGSLAPLVEQMVASGRGDVRWTPALDAYGVAAALDDATVLVLPSRTEGMGRVIVEAFCRGRGVVGSDDGGIPDLVDERSGRLVPSGDAAALETALVAVLADRRLAASLGQGAHEARAAWVATAAEFAGRFRALIDMAVRG